MISFQLHTHRVYQRKNEHGSWEFKRATAGSSHLLCTPQLPKEFISLDVRVYLSLGQNICFINITP
jgi:hypothetical protein